jgi:DNA-binding CsgD family transcriptional regulator
MPPAGAPVPVVGRDRELAAMRSVLDRLGSGYGQAVLIEGEPGVGKSRLLAEVLGEAEARAFTVVRGAAEELDLERPFGVLAEALALEPRSPDALRAEIGRLLVRGRGADDPSTLFRELRFRLVDLVVSLLERLAGQAPLVVALDNLHWADPSTLLAIRHVWRGLRHLPLAIIATLRPLPRSLELEGTMAELADRGALHLRLGPLDDEGVRALVEETLGLGPGPDLLRLVARAGGNAFYILELLDALRDEARLEAAAGRAEVAAVATPPTLRRTILRRIGFLPKETLEVVRMASLLGSSFSVADLSTVLGRPPLDLVGHLDAAMRAGVLGEADGLLAFRHDLVREAVYEELSLPLRKGLHLQIGRALAEAGATPTQVASHLALGAAPGDAHAVAWIRRAAHQARPLAPSIAVELLRHAVELSEPNGPMRDELLAELVWALLWARHVVEAENLARQVLERTSDPSVAGMLHYSLAKALQAQGRIAESLHQLETGLALPGLSEQVRVKLLAELAGRRLHCRDTEGARAAGEQAVAGAERLDSAPAACAALSSLSFLATLQGRLAEAEALGNAAVAIADRDGSGEAQLVGSRILQAFHRVYADRLEEAEAIVARGLRLDESGLLASLYHAIAAIAHFHQGRWEEAVVEAETSLAVAGETGNRVLSMLAHAVVAHVAVHRGELGAARRSLDAAEGELAGTGPARFGLPWLMWARARLHEAEGEDAAALCLLEGTWELTTHFELVAECYELTPDLVLRAVAAGRTDLAAATTAAMEGLAGRMQTAVTTGTALHCRGLLADDPAALSDAVCAFRRGSRPFPRARASEDAGGTLARRGRVEEAVSALDEALAVYDQLGAHRDSARADAALRALGVRRGRRGPRARGATGWESLTPAEVAVVRLTAEGLTNREIGSRLFISPRTVATHLSHVFGKLGLSTRVELVAAASRRPPVGAGQAGGNHVDHD